MSFRKVKDKGLTRENYSEQLKCSSFWPHTHRQHSHLQLVRGYLHNASGGLWQGWQVQVRISEPVPQNSELASRAVCKDLSTWDLVADSFSLSPRAVIITFTWTCLFHQETSIQVSFTFSSITETHSTAAHKNCRFFTLF